MEERKIDMYRLSDGLPSYRVMNDGEVSRCNRKYLQARRDLCKKRSDESDENRDFDGAGIRRKHRYGIGEDERRYPEGQDL